jgi:uncharacterized pyridoxal phosphate-containing UPF0001 family protein
MESTSQKQAEIRDRYNQVLERIGRAARDSGRKPEDIRLVVVTKTQPVDIVQYAVDAGAKDFGENYVEEAIPKINAEKKTLRWHMISITNRKHNFL